jgi:hypothetical protein
MPPISELADKFDLSAGRRLVIRLLGPDRQEIEKLSGKRWDRVVSPKDEGLGAVAQVIREQAEGGRQVVVNVNNHYEGCAVISIDRLLGRMG